MTLRLSQIRQDAGIAMLLNGMELPMTEESSASPKDIEVVNDSKFRKHLPLGIPLCAFAEPASSHSD
jgi:hypothetical protein